MSAADPQLARVAVLLAVDRAPEPDEREIREIAQHLGATAEATPTAEATTAEAAR